MCGRFNISYDLEDISKAYIIQYINGNSLMQGEIFPGNTIPVVLDNTVRTLDFFRWGFQVKGLSREIINARIETVLDKSTFRRSFLNSRCLIPANAFFEWKTTEKSKAKYKIQCMDTDLFSMAGIYDLFQDKNGNDYFGVVILTCAANEEMSKLHHRMPVFIEKFQEETWFRASQQELFKLKESLEKDSKPKLHISPAEGFHQLSMW